MNHLTKWLLLTTLVSSLWACGSGGGSGSSPASGTVTELWADFCVATFTEDYTVVDAFDDTLFTARSGETYLVSGFTDFAGEFRTTLIYLTGQSPIGFEIGAADVTDFPFETNCTRGETTSLLGIFADTTFFRDEGVSEPLCELAEGSIATGLLQTRLVSGFDFSSGPTVYKVSLGEFSEDCDGLEEAYVVVRAINRFGASYFEPPIARVLRPGTQP